MNNGMRKFRKNAKALSPVVASIILIAVTVAVSVVVAAWMGGMTTGLMGNAEQATITNIAFNNSGPTTVLNVTIQNTGSAPITFSQFYANGVQYLPTDGNPTLSDNTVTLPKSTTGSVTITLTTTLVSGTDCTVKMTSTKDNNIQFTQTVP
jgi:flagellin-like protein